MKKIHKKMRYNNKKTKPVKRALGLIWESYAKCAAADAYLYSNPATYPVGFGNCT